jgi:hypothetical protein
MIIISYRDISLLSEKRMAEKCTDRSEDKEKA